MHQQETAFESIVGKRKIARNEQFLLFAQCLLVSQIIVSPFVHIFDIISLFAAELEVPKIGISGKGLECHSFARQNSLDDTRAQRSYSPTILKNVISVVLQILLYSAAFKCNTSSDWLNSLANQKVCSIHISEILETRTKIVLENVW